MKQIKSFLLNSWATTLLLARLKYDGYRLKLAVYIADSKQRAHNKQYFVMVDFADKLQVLCPDEMDQLKKPIRRKYFEKGHYFEKKMKDGSIKKKYVKGGLKVEKIYNMSPKAGHLDIMKECFYYTPAKLNNTGGLTPIEREAKAAAWLWYMEKTRRGKKKL